MPKKKDKHVMSITYEPKVQGVIDGTITTTIRKRTSRGRVRKKGIKVGDTITLHGWEGVPYRSKWSWRKRVRVTEVTPATFKEEYVRWGPYNPVPWDGIAMDHIARKDGIDPPTGLQLRDVLKGLQRDNGKGWEGEYIHITWEVLG